MGVAVAPMFFFSCGHVCWAALCIPTAPNSLLFVLSLFTGMAAVAPPERLLAEVKHTDEQRALERQHPCTPLQPGQVDAFAAQATLEGGQADAIRWGLAGVVVALAVAEWFLSPFTEVCTWDWAVLADRGRVP